MKCPCSGAADLIRDTRDMRYSYKGKNTVTTAVTGEYWLACDEVILEREHGDRMIREMLIFSEQIDADKSRS